MLMMLPFEAPTVFESIHKSCFRMPRVVRDQRQRFENDDLFRQLSHESAVKYTGFKDRPLEERQMKFITNCQEGHTEVSVVQSGNQFTLMFNPAANPAYNNEGCDFDKERGKVHIKAGFILNGVCVLWRGWIDLQRLEGFGCLEYDEYRAYLEDAMVRQQIEKLELCNTSANGSVNGLTVPMQLPPPPPPPVRLNHQPIGPPPPPMDHAAAAAAAVAAVTTNSMLPGAPPQLGLCGPPPPVSLADSNSAAAAAAAAAHYGNAAIAAAAAAAFHQALQVNGQSNGGGHQQPLQPHAQYSNAGAALAMGLHGISQPQAANNTLPYTGGQQNCSPPTATLTTRKSPERENHTTAKETTSKRQAIKRQHEDTIPQQQQQQQAQDQMTQLAIIDEQNANDHLDVDVVSDISTHDLDLISSQRRMYKSSESIHHHPHNNHNHHHPHHHHHTSHHKISRRA